MAVRQRRMSGLALAGTMALLPLGCGSNDEAPLPPAAPTAKGNEVPAAFKSACGHPDRVVTVDLADLPVTIAHAACDLRGVTIKTASGSDVVPGGATSGESKCNAPTGCPSISVNPDTTDVTVTA
jgi:hypothetical protein